MLTKENIALSLAIVSFVMTLVNVIGQDIYPRQPKLMTTPGSYEVDSERLLFDYKAQAVSSPGSVNEESVSTELRLRGLAQRLDVLSARVEGVAAILESQSLALKWGSDENSVLDSGNAIEPNNNNAELNVSSRLDEVERSFDDEEQDIVDGINMSEIIRSALDLSDFPQSMVISTTCKLRLCRFEVEHPELSDTRRFLTSFLQEEILSGETEAHTSIVGGKFRTIIFLKRG